MTSEAKFCNQPVSCFLNVYLLDKTGQLVKENGKPFSSCLFIGQKPDNWIEKPVSHFCKTHSLDKNQLVG